MEFDVELAPQPKLPVFAVGRGCYCYVWNKRRALAVPLLILFVLNLCLGLLTGLHSGQSMLSMVLPGGAGLFLFVCGLAFTVGVNRTILLNESCGGAAFFRWGAPLWQALLTILKVMLCYGVVLAGPVLILALGLRGHWLGNGMGLLLFFLMFGLMLYMAPRLGLAVCAAAIGEKNSLSLSWQATKGNVLRLLGVGMLVAFPIIVLQFCVQVFLFKVGQNFNNGWDSVPGLLWSSAVFVIFQAVTAAMISLGYDALAREGKLLSKDGQSPGLRN